MTEQRLKHFGWGREGEGLTAEEEASSLPTEGEEMSPEDLEAAIEAELGGRSSR